MMHVRRRRSAMALCLPLIGCLNGDFGRVRPSLQSDDMHAWIGVEANRSAGYAPSQFPLTDDERLLRDLAYPLIAPPYDRIRWDAVLEEYGMTGRLSPDWSADPQNYVAALFAAPRRSQQSLYAELNDDIRNDLVRIGPFQDIARRVSDMDVKRRKSLAYVSALSPEESADAMLRVAENSLTVAWVHRSLRDRAGGYRFALERLVIAVPSSMAVEVERSLTLLNSRLAQLRVVPAALAAPSGSAPPLVAKD